jgi:hypothetical protein
VVVVAVVVMMERKGLAPPPGTSKLAVQVASLLSAPLNFQRLFLYGSKKGPIPSYTTMPTPESPAFLAKKPQVPPTFDGVDYDDQRALKAAQDAIVREQWIKVMMMRLVREKMAECYWREGVNHLEKCGHLRGQ